MRSKLFLPFLLLCGGFLLFQACKTQKESRVADSTYACPMHPEVTGKKGDHCSKCHMALTQSAAVSAVACCPKHKECTGKMGAKCPKCGTPLEQSAAPYTCPMHPDQQGKKGSRCPKCHMGMESKGR